ncbi:hypothetical protein K435DRAFT_855012 [Dendrothele bispora CBS 962.96]|uniref:Uncharacterized protein n=1 Tax=Dendrothele bispora (strain CBS 962.96) TaxID=1314807 RepID=A0A4S8MCJ0_DENBC|nr:hypothetical protein K435DRAFT_855012 [Dendrothele bispora CBS 962.96]
MSQYSRVDTRSFEKLVRKCQTLEALRLIGLEFGSETEFMDVFRALTDQRPKRFRFLDIWHCSISEVSGMPRDGNNTVPEKIHCEKITAHPLSPAPFLELRILKCHYSTSFYPIFYLQSSTSEPMLHISSLKELVLLPEKPDDLRILEPCRNSLVKLTKFQFNPTPTFLAALATHLSSLTCLRNLKLQHLGILTNDEYLEALAGFMNVAASALLDSSESDSDSNDNGLCLTFEIESPPKNDVEIQAYRQMARILDRELSGLVGTYGVGPGPRIVPSSSVLEPGSLSDSSQTVRPSLGQANHSICRHRRLKHIRITICRNIVPPVLGEAAYDRYIGIVEASFPRLREVGCESSRGPGVLVTFESVDWES